MKTNVAIGIMAASALLALAACGSGGGGTPAPTPQAASSAEGLWIGSTSSSRTVTAFVLDDGSYWILYSVAHASALIGGFVQGTSSSLNGNFSSADGVDFNVEGDGINASTVSASYMARQSFNGTIARPALNQSYSFISSYNADYELTPSVSALAGTYTGIASTGGSTELTTMVISAPGVVAGTGSSGCKFLGTVKPRARGYLFDVAAAFSGGVCASGTSAVSGIGYFDASAKRFHLTALNKSRSDGLIFVGVKP